MIKVGDKVLYLGYKNNLYGDTDEAERDGLLVVGQTYTVLSVYNERQEIRLLVHNGGGWSLNMECIKKVGDKIRNLPSWF